MPTRPPPMSFEYVVCGWTKTIQLHSDVLLQESLDVCPKCGEPKASAVAPTQIEVAAAAPKQSDITNLTVTPLVLNSKGPITDVEFEAKKKQTLGLI